LPKMVSAEALAQVTVQVNPHFSSLKLQVILYAV
jgi:hypothetical protein